MQEQQMIIWAAALAVALALVHVFGVLMRFLDVIPRSRWLSLAGGVSVAYVFVHIFPELASRQEGLEHTSLAQLRFVEHHVYLVALAGVLAFYGLEKWAKSHTGRRTAIEEETPSMAAFWLHVGAFALYNVLVGYLLLDRPETSGKALALYGVAMGFHFLVNDYGLRHHHRRTYRRYGRWLLAAAVLAGYAASLVVHIPTAPVTVLFAFLAGGVIMNVLKEEMPEERKSRFLWFLLGAAVYTVLLLLF